MTNFVDDPSKLAEIANCNSALVHRGRFVRADFLLDMRDDFFVISICDGKVVNVNANRQPMPPWDFALRARSEDWLKFWQPTPQPGYNDIFALLKFNRLQLEGDIKLFMTHLLYFKELLSIPRGLIK